jgi:hypothetical protein
LLWSTARAAGRSLGNGKEGTVEKRLAGAGHNSDLKSDLTIKNCDFLGFNN